MSGDYTYISDYVEWARDRLLLPYYRNTVVIRAWAAAIGQQYQDLEDDLRDIIEQTLIPAAVGVQLDRIGAVIGQPRWGRSDADYRRLILARIAANASKGTPEAQLAVVLALFPSATSRVYKRMGVAYFEIDYEIAISSSDEDRAALEDLILTSAPAGVGFGMRETLSAPSPPFQLDTPGSGYDDGYLTTERTASA